MGVLVGALGAASEGEAMSHIDVLSTTAFYLDPFRPLLLAMIRAEGGQAAFVKAVQCSRPDVQTFAMALAIACKTIRNKVVDFQSRGLGPVLKMLARKRADPWTGESFPRQLIVSDEFIAFLATQWAPRGVANDPKDLNQNWPVNVIRIYREILNAPETDRLQEV